MQVKRKIVLIGIDAMMPEIVDELISRGKLPIIARLIEKGCYARANPCYPAETGTNWATISTGAPPAVHGCNYGLHIPGDPLDKRVLGFPSNMCQAEQLWQCFDRKERDSVVFDFPQSYPLNIKRIIHVGEDGRPSGSFREISTACGYTTEEFEDNRFTKMYLRRIHLGSPKSWGQLPESHRPPLETEIAVQPKNSSNEAEAHKFFLLLVDTRGNGYDEVRLYAGKNEEQLLGQAGLKQWSRWVDFTFTVNSEKIRTAFRFKPLVLTPDGSKLKVYFSQIYPQQGYAYPEGISEELFHECGPYLQKPPGQQVTFAGACDIETFYEESKQHAEWYGKAAKYVLGKYPWDLFMIKWHGPDYMEHICMHMIDPVHPLHDPQKLEASWEYFTKYYTLADNLIGDIVGAVGDESIIGIVSDHGQIVNTFSPTDEFMVEAGLTVRRPDGSIDWSRTKAACFYGTEFYVNLKGRDPEGIVEPGEEYEQVRDQIIEAALDLKESATGRHVFNLVARKEDLEFMGLGHEREPDVIACLQPFGIGRLSRKEYRRKVDSSMWQWSTGTHGPYLPSTKFSLGSMQALFILSGKGVKKSYKRERPIRLTQVAPTLCWLGGVPFPQDADDAIIQDFLED